MTRQIFISHSATNREAAEAIRAALEAAGMSCWIAPRDIPPGTPWAAAIMAGIAEVRLVLLVHSAASAASEMVLREVNAAIDGRTPVVPVRIDATSVQDAMQFYLGSTHWLDASAMPLAAHLPKIVTVVAQRLTRDAGSLARVTEPEAAAPSLALPDKPSIAVLPFANIGGDAEQEYFADGMTEEIITALSRVRSFFVIARNSSFTYKGRTVDAKQAGQELGVRYVVEGSVRKGGNRVRITGQLADAVTGAQLWADRFDGSIEDVFDLQDQVTTSLISAIEPSIRASEVERAQRKPTGNLAAYDLVLRAWPLIYAFTRDGLREGEALLRRASLLDPEYGLPKVLTAMCQWWQVTQGWVARSDMITNEIEHLAREAVAQAPNDPEVLSYGGFLLAIGAGDVRAGLPALLRAADLNPSSAFSLGLLAQVHAFRGDPASALACAVQSRRLSPVARQTATDLAVAFAHYMMGGYEDALVAADLRIGQTPSFQEAWKIRAACLARLGRMDEARLAVAELLRLAPDMTIGRHRAQYTVGSQGLPSPAFVEAYCEGLRMAGLPE